MEIWMETQTPIDNDQSNSFCEEFFYDLRLLYHST